MSFMPKNNWKMIKAALQMKILPLNMQTADHAEVQIMNIYCYSATETLVKMLMVLRFAVMSPIIAIAYRRNWSESRKMTGFCPFCENKPENAQHFVGQTNLNVSRSEEAGSSSSRQLKNETDVSKCHLSGCLEQGNTKIETGCSKIRNSESTLIQDAYGDSDTESESRDYSNEKSELYSTSDATSDDYDDSNEITVENTGGKNSYELQIILPNILRLRAIRTNFDVLDDDDDDDDDSDDGEDDDDDDDDCNESDETDSEQKFHQAIFRDNYRRRRGMKRNQGITYRR
ncbi:Uncharacterized protein BM_BM17223 [Brugia malayi]|uniref:Uncharacterized protein n=1 Tax=Brugia malayi TaxID=6279 RepID=A0A4E9FX06_BRUMA|nr:Uncharacterized protein BM_BM17223 [Brugia malayi]VIP00371.1 Uncharacterized protein BM_BM17223 [Brugia malayi]